MGILKERRVRPRLSVSPWAALAGGLFVYLADGDLLRALVLPVAVHELGHVAALRLLGCRIRELRLEVGGFCITYDAAPDRGAEALAAAAGPLAGFLYAMAAAHLGPDGALSAGISLLLSLINLIPAPPLDGGRIAAALLSKKAAAVLAAFSAAALTAAGLWAFFRGYGAALALTGVLLLCRRLVDQFSSSAMLPD